jgi:hypothetical protein
LPQKNELPRKWNLPKLGRCNDQISALLAAIAEQA